MLVWIPMIGSRSTYHPTWKAGRGKNRCKKTSFLWGENKKCQMSPRCCMYICMYGVYFAYNCLCLYIYRYVYAYDCICIYYIFFNDIINVCYMFLFYPHERVNYRCKSILLYVHEFFWILYGLGWTRFVNFRWVSPWKKSKWQTDY